MEQTKKWYTEEEMKKIRKSDYYRENLAQHIGKMITIDVPSCELQPYKEDKDRACLRDAKVVRIGETILPAASVLEVEHIWVKVKKSLGIDPDEPLRVIGIPYEYAHTCGRKLVRNIGLNVLHVKQNHGWVS